MDVFQKVLTRVYKKSGGKETIKVDVGEILKEEGFYPSRDQITSHLVGESWVTETEHKYVVRITHWGVAEAKKALSNTPDNSRAVEKDSQLLISNAREFVVMMEEFAVSPNAKKFGSIEKRYTDLGDIVSRLKSKLD